MNRSAALEGATAIIIYLLHKLGGQVVINLAEFDRELCQTLRCVIREMRIQ